MEGLVLAITLGSLAYVIWSMRRFLRSFREFIHVNTGEGTITTRLLPNLAFGALFFLLIYNSLLEHGFDFLGVPNATSLTSGLKDFNFLVGGGLAVYDMDSGKTIRLAPDRRQKMQDLTVPAEE